jgi:hypothetical protein
MEDTYRSLISSLFISIALLCLASCGGGGGSEQSAGNTDPPLNGIVNNGLTGRLYVNNGEEGVMVDLATGKASRVPDIHWDVTSNFRAGTKFSALPNADGSEFILRARDCEYYPDEATVKRYRDCLATVDASGKTNYRISIYKSICCNAKFSVDGNYIAFMHSDERYEYQPAELYISDKYLQKNISHTVIEHSTDYNSVSNWKDFDWARNGQIVYGYDKSIYITAPYNTVGTLIYTIPLGPNFEDEFVLGPKVSPDGTKIAFRLMTSANQLIQQGNVWVMNIDGTDPHKLVYTPDYMDNTGNMVSSSQVYNDLAWSPDGKFILVQEGGTSGDLVSGPAGASDNIYAVPSDSRSVALNDKGQNGIIKIRTYFESPDKLTYRFEPEYGTITWLK